MNKFGHAWNRMMINFTINVSLVIYQQHNIQVDSKGVTNIIIIDKQGVQCFSVQ